MKNICSYCNKDNEADNFLCSHCGFYLDLEISFNDFNLPTIKNKTK